jgi:hypothetical protein
MSKKIARTKIADADLRAMQAELDAAVQNAAVISLDLAEAIYRDRRGPKTLAKIAGAPHGSYQRRERLGMLVAYGAVIMPARPTDEADLEAWETEAAVAMTLHNACMRTGVTQAMIAKIAKDEEDSAMSPSEMLRAIQAEVAAAKDEGDFDLAAAIERLANQVRSTSEKSGETHAAIVTKITKALSA